MAARLTWLLGPLPGPLATSTRPASKKLLPYVLLIAIASITDKLLFLPLLFVTV
jgi:hypothetical protein